LPISDYAIHSIDIIRCCNYAINLTLTIDTEESVVKTLIRSFTAALPLLALLFPLAVPYVHASDHLGKCQHSIEKAEARLEKAIRDHGQRSRQAEERRRELNADRERCWNEHHQWWNGREHRWETERNWEVEHR
jgi:hypothetical protein